MKCVSDYCICDDWNNPWYQVNCEACGQPTPEFEPYKLKDASLAHDMLESRKGGGSVFLTP